MTDAVEPTDAELAVLPETGTGTLRLDLARRLTAEALGSRNGSKPCRLRPVGRIAGVRSRSPPGAGRR